MNVHEVKSIETKSILSRLKSKEDVYKRQAEYAAKRRNVKSTKKED